MSDREKNYEAEINGTKFSCVIDKQKGERTYTATTGDGTSRSLSLDENGYVRLRENNVEVAELHVTQEKTLRNIGGYEQYQYVKKSMDIETIDGVMDFYHKIQKQNFTTYDDSGDNLLVGEDKRKIGQFMTDFLDTYIFSNPASREVLDEYLDKATKEDNRREALKLGVYSRTLNRR